MNAALMRMRAGGGLCCSFASLIAFAHAEGRTVHGRNFSSKHSSHSLFSLSIELRLEGVLLECCFKDECSAAACNAIGPKRSFFNDTGSGFQFKLPFRAPSTVLLGLATKPSLLQRICRVFPLQQESLLHLGDLTRRLALVRLVQREVCFVTEEWEFRNAVLAVEFTQARELMFDRSQPSHEKQAIAKLEEVAHARDELALWMASTLAELQQSKLLSESELSELAHGACRTDLAAELAAAQAVLSAAMQKIFLPASVSRHDYHPMVIDAVYNWAAARSKHFEDDLACELTMLACAYHLAQQEFEERCYSLLLRVQNESSLDWVLSFDPSSALKAFCWSLRPEQYFCLLLTFACALKQKSVRQWPATGASSIPHWTFDSHWSSLLISCVQMPQTFPQTRTGRTDARRKFEAFVMPLWVDLLQETLVWFSDSREASPGETFRELWLKGFSSCIQGTALVDRLQNHGGVASEARV